MRPPVRRPRRGRPGRRGSIALLFLSLAGCVGPCAGSRALVRVDFVGPPAGASLSLPEDMVKVRLRAAADALPGFAVREASADEVGWQLTVRTGLATERTDDDDPGQVRRAFGAQAELVRLRPPEGSAPGRFAAEALEVVTVPRRASLEGLVERTLDRLMARLSTAVELTGADAARLAEVIRSGDEHARAVAVQAVRARKLLEARPAIEARLAADEVSAQEALRLAGALGALGSPESADAIIDAISRHPKRTVPLLFQLAEVGGKSATAYLFTVQSGHEDPGVRAAAKDALRQLEGAPRPPDARGPVRRP